MVQPVDQPGRRGEALDRRRFVLARRPGDPASKRGSNRIAAREGDGSRPREQAELPTQFPAAAQCTNRT